MQGCKPRIRAPRAVLLISELEPTSSHLRVPVCVCTARPHHDSVPQCARLTRCIQLLTFFVLHASPPTPRLSPPSFPHGRHLPRNGQVSPSRCHPILTAEDTCITNPRRTTLQAHAASKSPSFTPRSIRRTRRLAGRAPALNYSANRKGLYGV